MRRSHEFHCPISILESHVTAANQLLIQTPSATFRSSWHWNALAVMSREIKMSSPSPSSVMHRCPPLQFTQLHAIKHHAEAIHWSQGRSCQSHSALCSSSDASEELEASSFPKVVERPPPAASVAPRLQGWPLVWPLRKEAGNCRCCCGSSWEVG